MVGAAPACRMNRRRAAGPVFALASRADDAEIRRLLRETPMPGRITLSFEREPDYFRETDLPGVEQRTIIAREGGRVVCAGSCAIRSRFLNGQTRRVGYLGGLRLAASHAGRFDLLRRGYRFFHDVQRELQVDCLFTAVAADNHRAIRFLERGLPGMPRYDLLGDFLTILIPVPKSGRRSTPEVLGVEPARDFREVAECLNHHGARTNFAACWQAEELEALHGLGLATAGTLLLRRPGVAVACAALWDQRAFKQTVIRAYAPPLGFIRPLLNLAAVATGRASLPACGATLAHAVVSPLAVTRDEPEQLQALIGGVSVLAAERRLDWLTFGFPEADPRLNTLRAYRGIREYRSRLYRVSWPGEPSVSPDTQPFLPEVAWL